MKIRLVGIAILLVELFAQVSIHSEDSKALAVLDASGDGRLPAADIRLVSSQLIDTTNRLAKANYKIISISKRNEVLREIEFALSGVSDQSQYKRIGSLLSADLILSSKVGSKNPGYYFDISLLSVQTGEILATAIRHAESFSDLLQKAIPEAVCEVLSLKCDAVFNTIEKSELLSNKKMMDVIEQWISIADPTNAIGISYLKISEIKPRLTEDSLVNIIQDNDNTYIMIIGAFTDEFLNKKYPTRQIAIILPRIYIGIFADTIWSMAIEVKENGAVFIRTIGAFPREFYGLLNRVDMNIDDKLLSFNGVTITRRMSSGYMNEIRIQLNSEILGRIRSANKMMIRVYLGKQEKADVHITVKLIPECLRVF